MKTQCIHFTWLWSPHPLPYLYLKNKAPAVMFLGLLDSILTRETHPWWLCIKVTQYHKNLKVWGLGAEAWQWRFEFTVLWSARREIMTVSCRAPPWSLSCLQHIQTTGIRLAIGVFRTSQTVSLYMESGEPSLSVRRNLLLHSYAAKLATQPNHTSLDAVFHLTYSNNSLARASRTSFSNSIHTCCISFMLDSHLFRPSKSYDQPATFAPLFFSHTHVRACTRKRKNICPHVSPAFCLNLVWPPRLCCSLHEQVLISWFN
jgi:hypothetical protein